MAKVEVGFSTIIGDENFAVFKRVHGARIDVDVRVEFLHGDTQTTQFQESTERRGSQTFT